MINIFKRLRFGIKEKSLLYAFKYKEPDQLRPYDISYNLIIDIFKYMPRKDWYPIIKNLLWDINKNNNCVRILDDKSDPYPFTYSYNNIFTLGFNLEDLKISKFNIEPIKYYTHNRLGGIFISESYIPLDKRYKSDSIAKDRALFGSIVEGIGITSDGFTYGWEKGKIFLQDNDCFYSNFSPISYKPKEGEFLYYIEKLYKGELILKNPDDYSKNIFGNISDLIIKPGDTSYRSYFELFFK